MKTDPLNLIATILVATSAVMAWVFLFRYVGRNWRATPEGRHMMGLTLIIAVFLSLATEFRTFGPWVGAPVVALVLYAVLAFLMFQQNVLLWKADQSRPSRNHPDAK